MRQDKEIKKEKKRLKFGLLIIGLLIIFGVFGFLRKVNLWEIAFPARGILRPLPEKGLEDQFKEKLQEAGLEVIRPLKLQGVEVEASISGGTKIIFSAEKGISEQMASLQFLWERFKIEGKRPQKVDLRFEKPVVTF